MDSMHAQLQGGITNNYAITHIIIIYNYANSNIFIMLIYYNIYLITLYEQIIEMCDTCQIPFHEHL